MLAKGRNEIMKWFNKKHKEHEKHEKKLNGGKLPKLRRRDLDQVHEWEWKKEQDLIVMDKKWLKH